MNKYKDYIEGLTKNNNLYGLREEQVSIEASIANYTHLIDDGHEEYQQQIFDETKMLDLVKSKIEFILKNR